MAAVRDDRDDRHAGVPGELEEPGPPVELHLVALGEGTVQLTLTARVDHEAAAVLEDGPRGPT